MSIIDRIHTLPLHFIFPAIAAGLLSILSGATLRRSSASRYLLAATGFFLLPFGILNFWTFRSPPREIP